MKSPDEFAHHWWGCSPEFAALGDAIFVTFAYPVLHMLHRCDGTLEVSYWYTHRTACVDPQVICEYEACWSADIEFSSRSLVR